MILHTIVNIQDRYMLRKINRANFPAPKEFSPGAGVHSHSNFHGLCIQGESALFLPATALLGNLMPIVTSKISTPKNERRLAREMESCWILCSDTFRYKLIAGNERGISNGFTVSEDTASTTSVALAYAINYVLMIQMYVKHTKSRIYIA